MRRSTPLEVRTYRGHRLEVRDDGDDGWIVAIYVVGGGALPEVLRSSVPKGVAGLLVEAKRRVDRRLEGLWNDRPLLLRPSLT
jgi:hypothetical protein